MVGYWLLKTSKNNTYIKQKFTRTITKDNCNPTTISQLNLTTRAPTQCRKEAQQTIKQISENYRLTSQNYSNNNAEQQQRSIRQTCFMHINPMSHSIKNTIATTTTTTTDATSEFSYMIKTHATAAARAGSNPSAPRPSGNHSVPHDCS